MTLRTFLNLLRALARDYHPTTENDYDGCEHIRYRQPDKPPACPITLVAGELTGLRFPIHHWKDAAHALGLSDDDAALIAASADHTPDCQITHTGPQRTWLRRALLATFDQGGDA